MRFPSLYLSLLTKDPQESGITAQTVLRRQRRAAEETENANGDQASAQSQASTSAAAGNDDAMDVDEEEERPAPARRAKGKQVRSSRPSSYQDAFFMLNLLPACEWK